MYCAFCGRLSLCCFTSTSVVTVLEKVLHNSDEIKLGCDSQVIPMCGIGTGHIHHQHCGDIEQHGAKQHGDARIMCECVHRTSPN